MKTLKITYMAMCVLLLVSGCAYSGGIKIPGAPKPHHDAAPKLPQHVLSQMAVLPDPEVLDEPRSKRGNGPVYTVWGKSYRVMDSADGFVQEGTASWYGTKFHGRETSSGEVFDIYRLTAAHKHLPLTHLCTGNQLKQW